MLASANVDCEIVVSELNIFAKNRGGFTVCIWMKNNNWVFWFRFGVFIVAFGCSIVGFISFFVLFKPLYSHLMTTYLF